MGRSMTHFRNHPAFQHVLLHKVICIINLLSNLADDLKEFIKLSIQKLEEKENFFAEYFKELDRLKVVLLTEEIKIDDIKWFFNTNRSNSFPKIPYGVSY